MSKRLSVLLEEILLSVQLIRQYTSNLSKDDFFAATQIQDAALRRIEIIGEAVKS